MISVLTAIVTPPHLSVSGAARAAERLSAALTAHCRVTVASMMPDTTHDPNVAHARVGVSLPPGLLWSYIPKRYRTPFYRSDISARIRSGGYDIVHLHNPMPALEMRRIATACRRSGIPYVVSTHGFNEIANGAGVYGFGALRCLLWHLLIYNPLAHVVGQAAAVLLLSPADAPIVRAMGFRGRIMPTAPNGMEPPPSAGEVDAETLGKFGIGDKDSQTITCMFLANHTPNKGLPILFRAFGSLNIPFLLIVGGEQRDDVDYGGFARQLKTGQRVIITGRLRDDEIAALMRRSDLFVFPTLADTLPLVVQEAIAHGLPVVASRVGGIPHQIDDRCGALVPPNDAAALAATIQHLAADRTLLSAMSKAATARAARLTTWDDTAAITYAAYQAVLAAHRIRHVEHPHPKVPGAGSEPIVRAPQ
jgi:glycosyltransferase involved in cell wall biosynthesis